ncbi:MAG TPA: hypothetical protein VEW05_29115 [Candidatus Polarisedimenticolia bacterium]|nr:hypothetical protein [Candidatus Polarisedimenticolia bacterium]
MMQTARPGERMEFAHSNSKPATPWKRIFRIIRWTTYTFALVMLVLVLHKAPPPLVETSPQAAARAEEKFERVERAVANGQPATLRMDETELNSYLGSHLALEGNVARNPPATAGAQAAPGGPTPQEIEQMRSNVRDVKVQLIDDRVKAYVVFDVHGKDMTLQLEGRLAAQNGYLRFEPLGGQIGSMPIPQSALESAVQRLMDSPENRDKLRLPPEISDLRIQNGEVVASYQ